MTGWVKCVVCGHTVHADSTVAFVAAFRDEHEARCGIRP